MKTVRVVKIVSDDETQLHSLDELMRVLCSAKRYAFNRLLEGMNAQDIIKHLRHQFPLNKRYAEDAVLLAQSLISFQRELLPMRLEDVQVKMEKAAKKMDEYQHGRKTPKNVDIKTCLNGLHQRLEKLKATEAELQDSFECRYHSKSDFWRKTKLLQAPERKHHERRMERFAIESVVCQRR
ncbi:transposase [Thermaerobacillus caldiproteolyticus]|uniref:Putative transposase n=1 Tax=Thermaerobacillus caldiproteolyticus TaxID=247480 RepID=A0A7V9Z871_9BACL|nr:transposase [Anoxybacillus caldiproteolyticus]MBA2875840.1 putative transposase [Anoxybacillus caldiproteolyticus]